MRKYSGSWSSVRSGSSASSSETSGKARRLKVGMKKLWHRSVGDDDAAGPSMLGHAIMATNQAFGAIVVVPGGPALAAPMSPVAAVGAPVVGGQTTEDPTFIATPFDSTAATADLMTTGQTPGTLPATMGSHGLAASPVSPVVDPVSGDSLSVITGKPDLPDRGFARPSPWEAALEQLSPEDQQALNLNTLNKLDALDQVLEATKKKRDLCRQKQWKFTWKGENIILRDVADKLLAWVDKYKAIGDMIASFDPIHATLPWQGFTFLLQVAIDDAQKMGALLVGLEKVANLMGRCLIYETLYLTALSGKFEETIIELYAHILRFLVQSGQYYSKKTAVRVVCSAFDTAHTAFLDSVNAQEAIIVKMVALAEAEYKRSADNRLEGQIAGLADALDKRIIEKSVELEGLLHEFTNPIVRMQADLDDLRDGLEDTERTAILMWLSKVEYAKHHLNAREGRVDGTGDWLLRRESFLRWQTSSASTIHWLHGIPGAGKTKLTSRVIDNLIQQREGTGKSEAFAYFYCKRDEVGSCDPEDVMRTIVKQLSCPEGQSQLRKEVVQVYQARKQSGFSSGSLAFRESLDLVISLVNSYPQTTIVVDALDECDPVNRKEFLRSLGTIINNSSSLVKIFVSSRDDSDIALRLEDVANLSINAKDNAEDIRRFVQHEVTRCIKDKELLRGHVREDLKEKIITSLTNGSQGMFLWVDLQIKQICSMTVVFDVEERLGKLPDTLEKTYTEIYKQIQSAPGSSSQLAETALMWVMCSCRPFSPDELVAIISLGSVAASGLDVGGLFKLCRNLLTLDHQQNIVRFAHLSTREFLERSCFTLADAHCMASRFCLSYLMNPQNLATIRTLGQTSYGSKCPIIGYPAIYWTTHVQGCLNQQDCLDLPELLVQFLQTSVTDWYNTTVIINSHRDLFNREGPWQDMRELRFPKLVPQHVACVFGFGEKIKRLWDSEKWDVNARNARGRAVLDIASERGCSWTVTTLLNKGADINAQAGEYGNALQAAVEAGHEKMVELLLDGGADVNAQGNEYRNPLWAAVEAGDANIVTLLLERGADINAAGGEHGNALHAAVDSGNEILVELLLDRGADVNTQGGEFGNALQAAVDVGNENIIDLLLKRGADVNAQGGEYGNALRAAVEASNEKIVERLLDGGADVNAQDTEYGDALQAAAQAGELRIVGLLLERGADVNAQGSEYGNPLQAAVYAGDEMIVQMLLDRGANVNAQGGEFGNALQAAAQAGEERTVELLLARGADANAQGGVYGNALQAAARAGKGKAVELLLERGADVNAQGGEYGNALQAAVEAGNEGIVWWLIERGADVNALGKKHGNALQVAARVGQEKIVVLLLERGADVNAHGGQYGNALQAAVEADNVRIVELLLERGADVNAQDSEYGNALQAAVEIGNELIVELLLVWGADINAQGGRFGNALQAAAAQIGHEKIIELLLDRGANVNAQGGEFGNALQAAAQAEEWKAVELLLERGAAVNSQGGEYGNALQAAVYVGNEKVVQILLGRGADANSQGSCGSALYTARMGRNEKIINLLVQAGANS